MAQIYISVGSNINMHQHISAGLDAMFALFGELTLSSVFESEAVGFSGDDFYNLVVGAKTELSPLEVTVRLKEIEKNNGRKCQIKKFAPRTLDLDLLLYDDVIMELGVQIPRNEITKNAFVLWPLAELAPNLLHPVAGQSYEKLWSDYDKNQQKLWKVAFHWR